MVGEKRSLSNESTSSDKVTIRVYGQLDGRVVHFLVKRDVPLRKVLLTYCESKHLEYTTMVFLYKGDRVHVRRTPDELHMKDGDRIEAMFHVDGGGF